MTRAEEEAAATAAAAAANVETELSAVDQQQQLGSFSQSSGNLLDASTGGATQTGGGHGPENGGNMERTDKKFGGATFNIKRHKVTDLATYQEQMANNTTPKKGLHDSNVLRKAASITLEQVGYRHFHV